MENLMIVPTKLLELECLTHSSRVLYLHMLKYAHDQVTCFPSIELLSKDMGMSERTILRYASELFKYGLIKYVRGSNGNSNRYVIIPMEWVDGEAVGEGEYDLTPTEFNILANKIRDFYEAEGRELLVNKKGKSKKSIKKSPRTRIQIIEELKANLCKADFKPTQGDYAYYFAMILQNVRGDLYEPSNKVRDYKALTEMFITSDMDKDLAFKIIEVYIKVYDEFFANDKYRIPLVNNLRVDWIFNKVKAMAEIELRKSRAHNEELADEVF